MKRTTFLILLILFLTAIASSLQAAVSIPQPSSQFYVLDQANVLDQSTEDTIVQTSAALAQKTKAQIVVVTVNTLGGAAPEDYALAILRGWGIGDKNLNNGLLMLVCPQERISRIEVGYGLEGALPDAKTGQIQDQYMLPYFQNNDYNQGILNGYRALVQVVAQEYQVTVEISTPQAPSAATAVAAVPPWMMIIFVILIILLIYLDHRFLNGFFLGLLLGILFRGRGGGGGFGGGGYSGGGGWGGGGGSTRRW
jgi:uncharacterized protein